MERKFGALLPEIDVRDYQYTPAKVCAVEELPKEFSLITADVRDQGSVGSCVAHVAEEIEEYFNLKQHNRTDRLSPGYIYGCRYTYKGEGMYLRDALKTLQKRGIAKWDEFPYNKEVPDIIDLFEEVDEFETDSPNKISTYFSISVDDREYKIKKALMDHGPVMVSVKWYRDIKVKNGIMTTSQTGNFGYHCIMIYGWNEKGWLIQNSWGKLWGNRGKAVYPYEYPFVEVWGITDTIYSDDIKKKDTKNKFIQWLYKICNKVINFFKELFNKNK